MEKNPERTKRKHARRQYKALMRKLQIELVKLQKHFIHCQDKILVLLEGRDCAGKDGVIKRIVKHLSPRETRVVALGKPSERETGTWYFQRYVQHLPAPGEFVLFNRSWYNRAGVERVMGFCSEKEYEEFVMTVKGFETMLVRSGIRLLKYYLDISRKEQRTRLKDRRRNPLTQWKLSPIDAKANKLWNRYSKARDEMLMRTNHKHGAWIVVRANDKRLARVNLIEDMLSRLHYPGKEKRWIKPDPRVVFTYRPARHKSGLIEP